MFFIMHAWMTLENLINLNCVFFKIKLHHFDERNGELFSIAIKIISSLWLFSGSLNWLLIEFFCKVYLYFQLNAALTKSLWTGTHTFSCESVQFRILWNIACHNHHVLIKEVFLQVYSTDREKKSRHWVTKFSIYQQFWS
jgi:hypothetical protein